MNKTKKKNFAIIIQVRLNSQRLKNKILKKIYKNQSVIEFLLVRLLKVFNDKNILIALAKNKKNYKIKNILSRHNIRYYEGSEGNVLKRYYECADKYNVKDIIRITSDCPLIDPYLIKKMYKRYMNKNLEYLANTLPTNKRTFPDGSDIEVFRFKSLKKIFKMNLKKSDKEHVTNKFWSTKRFKKQIYTSSLDNSNYRYCIDYLSDFKAVKFIINNLKNKKKYGTINEIIKIIDKNSKIKKILSRNSIKHKSRRRDIYLS